MGLEMNDKMHVTVTVSHDIDMKRDGQGGILTPALQAVCSLLAALNFCFWELKKLVLILSFVLFSGEVKKLYNVCNGKLFETLFYYI